MEYGNNIVIVSIYRAPGSNTGTFYDMLHTLLDKPNVKKSLVICGDCNFDQLNLICRTSSNFPDTLYSYFLYPLITKPSHVSGNNATLIDKIFVNIMDNSIKSGLLINDISDNLPIFRKFDCKFKSKTKVNEIKYVRLRTESSITNFRKDLLYHN